MGEPITKGPGGPINWDHPCRGVTEILDREQGRVRFLMPDGVTPRTKVAIVGFATSSRDLAPWDDPEWAIMGLNQLDRHIPRADAWWEIHVNWNEHVVEGTDHQGFLASAPIPTFMATCVPDIPHSVRYPLQWVIDTLQCGDYFQSTIAFEIAWAIASGFEEIGVWGVDLIVGSEHFYQRANAEYFLGIAIGKGINVRLPAETALCRALYRYGYEIEPDFGLLNQSRLSRRLQELQKARQQHLVQLYQIDGAGSTMRRLYDALKTGTLAPDGVLPRLEEQIRACAADREKMAATLYALDGGIAETERWGEFLDLRQRAGRIEV